MSDTYEAWDGKCYPKPAPTGWSERPDGRWWPQGQGPLANENQTAGATPSPTPVVPAPSPPTAAPVPGSPMPVSPMPSQVPAKKKGMSTGAILLFVFLGFLVLSVGGCLFSTARFFGRAGTLIEEGREEFDSYTAELEAEQAEAESQVSLDDTTCEVDGLTARVSGEVDNDGSQQYSYSITVQFTGSDNRRLDPGFASINSVAAGETIVFDVEVAAEGVDAEIRCTVSKVSRSEG